MAASFTFAVDNLFVCQHGTQSRAPVHGKLRLIGQAFAIFVFAHRRDALSLNLGRNGQFGDWAAPFGGSVVPGIMQQQEDPLGPAEIGGVSSIHFAVPVIAEAQHLDLAAEVVDVFFGGHTRVCAGFDGVLLGGKAECIPTHGVHHREAAHAFVAGQNVSRGVTLGVAHMEAGP